MGSYFFLIYLLRKKGGRNMQFYLLKFKSFTVNLKLQLIESDWGTLILQPPIFCILDIATLKLLFLYMKSHVPVYIYLS